MTANKISAEEYVESRGMKAVNKKIIWVNILRAAGVNVAYGGEGGMPDTRGDQELP